MSLTLPHEALPLPDLYYEHDTKQYWMTDERDIWITVNETSAKRFLREQRYSGETAEKENLSPLEKCVLRIQQRQNVAYAAELAGHDSGVYDISERKILVTQSPRCIQPGEGDWPVLRSVLTGMFGHREHDQWRQLDYLYGWLKLSLESYRSRQWQPGQIMVFAGPVQSAKSLLQQLITELFGGRSAKPYQYMTGKTPFNGDTFRAEHLVIEDEAESTDIRNRRHFGAKLKEIAVNREQNCHRKHRTPLMLNPIWRMTISLNDEPERLMVLPPLDEDIQDKVMLLKVARRDMPMPTETPQQQQAFWDTLKGELPAFVGFLQAWEIPEDLRGPRFGIRHFHHPDLVEALNNLAPETRLLELIDEEVFSQGDRRDAWEGVSIELENTLKAKDSGCREDAQNLLHYFNSCGTYLGRLERDGNPRLQSRAVGGRKVWTIQPPPPLPGVIPFPAPNGSEEVGRWTSS